MERLRRSAQAVEGVHCCQTPEKDKEKCGDGKDDFSLSWVLYDHFWDNGNSFFIDGTVASTYIGASKIDLQGVSLKKGPILTASRLLQLVNILPEKKAFFAEFSLAKPVPFML